MCTPKIIEIHKSMASLNYLEHIARVAKRLVLTTREMEYAEANGFVREASRLEAKQESLIDELSEATRLLDNLDSLEADILTSHYLYDKDLETIGKHIGYSKRSVARYAAQGRVKLYESLPDYWKDSVLLQ